MDYKNFSLTGKQGLLLYNHIVKTNLPKHNYQQHSRTTKACDEFSSVLNRESCMRSPELVFKLFTCLAQLFGGRNTIRGTGSATNPI